VTSEEASLIVKQKTNILHILNRRNANFIGHTLLRNCLLKHVNEGKVEGRIEVMQRRGRRRKQPLSDSK